MNAEQLRESGLVLVRAEGDQEEFNNAQLRMPQPVDALHKCAISRPSKDKGELLADLAFGPWPAHFAAFSGLDEVQCDAGAIPGRDVEGLPHQVGEVVAREPLKVSHEAMVPASELTSRTGT